MDVVVSSRLQFGRFALDPMRRVLWSGEREIPLRPKSFDVLCLLVERHGRLATKDEIFQAVWPNVAVTDDSLVQCVKDIRQALGDTDQQIVKTVPGRGYVFAAPVSTLEDHAVPVTAAVKNRWTGARWPAAAAVGLVVVIGAGLLAIAGGLWPQGQPAGLPLPDRPSIAVLPFANLSGDANQDYVSDGITQDLTTSLGKFGELFVIADNSAFRYRGSEVGSARIGRDLGVRYLLKGSVRKDAERIRITAQVVEASSGAQIWGEHYDRAPAGVFAVQDDVVEQIVVRLVDRIGRSELQRALRKPPESWAAYDHYLRGNAHMRIVHRDRSGATMAVARTEYQQSLALDPRYAPALRGLALADATVSLNPVYLPSLKLPMGDPRERQALLDRAERQARQAIELDPTLAEAYGTLAYILNFQRGPSAGLPMFERAFELNPNLVDGRYAVLLAHAGRAPEAIAYVKRIMRLDPLYPELFTYLLGKSYYFAGQYEQAIDPLRISAKRLPVLNPVLPVYISAALHSGHAQEARAAAAELRKMRPDFTISGFLHFMRLERKEYNERLAASLRQVGFSD